MLKTKNCNVKKILFNDDKSVVITLGLTHPVFNGLEVSVKFISSGGLSDCIQQAMNRLHTALEETADGIRRGPLVED